MLADFNIAEVLTGAMPKPEPSSAEVFQQATALHRAGEFDKAEAVLRRAIGRDPDNSDLHNARGVMLAAMQKQLEALCCYRNAIACSPSAAGIWTNLGNSLTRSKHLKSAIWAHRRAIALAKTDDALLWHNLGVSLAEAGQHGEAVAAFTKSIEFDPGRLLTKWDRGRSYLYLGNYRQAWPDYEARRFTGQLPAKKLPGKAWEGQPYAGGRLVLVVEQGFGDTIWVARYLPKVKALGGELVMECQSELVPLIQQMEVADRLVPCDQPLPDSDYHCHLCSLPGLFTHELASIPSMPYLRPPSARLTKFQRLIKQPGGTLNVGVVWSGSVTFGRNSERAQPLLRFIQAFALPGVQLYSLQKGPPEQDLRDLPLSGQIIDLAPHLKDFADTAAAVGQLDLVIMTDSAVAHLCGAMGKPVWVLLGHVAHWLWLLDRVDSPWYPSLRLFRPRAEGDWDYVFDSASVELMNLARI